MPCESLIRGCYVAKATTAGILGLRFKEGMSVPYAAGQAQDLRSEGLSCWTAVCSPDEVCGRIATSRVTCICMCGCPAGMPQPGGVVALFQNGADAGLKDPQREAALSSSNIPHIVVKAGIIEDVPGGASKVTVAPFSGSSSSQRSSSIAREDLASALVASAVYLPGFVGSSSSGGSAAQLAFEVQDAGPGQPPEDWATLLESAAKTPVAQ
jgi:hypothetical protein